MLTIAAVCCLFNEFERAPEFKKRYGSIDLKVGCTSEHPTNSGNT